MRAIKTVLRECARAIQEFPEEEESKLVWRSLREVNLPRLIPYDIPLFENILSDLFPNLKIGPKNCDTMKIAFTEVCTELNLQPLDVFFDKTAQSFEMMKLGCGVIFIGEPFAGKSTTLKVLAKMFPKIRAGEEGECQLGKIFRKDGNSE